MCLGKTEEEYLGLSALCLYFCVMCTNWGFGIDLCGVECVDCWRVWRRTYGVKNQKCEGKKVHATDLYG